MACGTNAGLPSSCNGKSAGLSNSRKASAKSLSSDCDETNANGMPASDRIWILAPGKEGDELAGRLSDAGIPFAFVSSQSDESELADAFLLLDSPADFPLQDDGRPALVPHAMAALYIYYAVRLSIDELLAE